MAHAYGGVPQQCKTVYETKCWDEPREKCKTEQKPYTVTVHDTHCVTHHEEKCNTEYENKVKLSVYSKSTVRLNDIYLQGLDSWS